MYEPVFFLLLRNQDGFLSHILKIKKKVLNEKINILETKIVNFLKVIML